MVPIAGGGGVAGPPIWVAGGGSLSGGDGSDPIVDRAVELRSWLQRTLGPDDAVRGLIVAVVLAAVAATAWRSASSGTFAVDRAGVIVR